jgi:hypothetical protein
MLHKVHEWSKRYLPAEIVCTITALIGAGVTHYITGNPIATAFAGTWGENIGYYGYISYTDLKKRKNKNKKLNFMQYLLHIRDLIFEFGFSEILDSFLIRPALMYVIPQMLNNVMVGIFIAKITADIIFYIPTIIAYELKKKYIKN